MLAQGWSAATTLGEAGKQAFNPERVNYRRTLSGLKRKSFE